MAGENQGLQDVILHLPAALRDRAEEMASRESLSLNLFVLMAVAEKLQRMQLQYCLDLSERDEVRSAAGPVSDSRIH
jgi:hypothetical protein